MDSEEESNSGESNSTWSEEEESGSEEIDSSMEEEDQLVCPLCELNFDNCTCEDDL